MGVRQMELSDLDQIIETENEVQLHPWPIQAFQQALLAKQYCAVFEEDGQVIGYFVADGGHGRTIAAKTFRAAGALYRSWFAAMAQAGVTEAWAEIEPTNRAARVRLERFGFTMVGVRPSFYGPGLDAQVWQRANLAESTEDQKS